MKLKVTVILAIALQSSFSVSQYDRPVPNLPVPQHQWKIASVVFRRFINTTPKLTGYFMLDRFFYDPCATAPGETIMPQHECGIRATTYPSIQCSSWPDQFKVGELGEVSIEDKDQQGTEVYTCHTYRTGKGYDIKSLPKEEKKWLKWKMFDLRESTIVPNPRGQSFQSVQFELTNGVPVVNISSSGRATTTNWIQTYTSTYTMHGNSSSCSGFGDGEITFFPDPEEAVRNRQYACSNSEEDASLGIKSAVPKIICGGSPELYECSSLVDIKKGLVTTDVWDEQFQ